MTRWMLASQAILRIVDPGIGTPPRVRPGLLVLEIVVVDDHVEVGAVPLAQLLVLVVEEEAEHVDQRLALPLRRRARRGRRSPRGGARWR